MVINTVEPSSRAANTRPSFALRVFCSVVALAMGGAEAWWTRFTMNPDGVSYLDIGDAYWRGDWHNAINAYWSPLCSWIVGFALKVVAPSMYWEYPLVHLVNFLMYVGAVASFEFFLSAFVTPQQERNLELGAGGEFGIPAWGWYVLGYSLFIWTALVLVGLRNFNPDLLVYAFACLDFGLLLRIQREPGKRNFLLLGLALGFGYLAKAALFPIGFVFLAITALSAKTYRGAIAAALVFLVLAAPFIAAISYAKHRLTFGDSGRIAYAAYVSNLDLVFPGDGGDFYPDGMGHAENIDKPSPFGKELVHPARKIFDRPAAYSFGESIAGTYPFWFDVSYWQDGIQPSFQFSRETEVLKYSLEYSLAMIWGISYQLTVTASLLLLFFLAPRPSVCLVSAMKNWHLLVPSVVSCLMYSIVHFEFRYVAPFVCIGWLVLFSGVRLPQSDSLRVLLRSLILLVAISQVASAGNFASGYLKNKEMQHDLYSSAARCLRTEGLTSGAKIAMISDLPMGQGGPYVARLARLQIVAQINTPSQFWSATPAVQDQVLKAFAAVGARAVVSWNPEMAPAGWKELGDTRYFIYPLQ